MSVESIFTCELLLVRCRGEVVVRELGGIGLNIDFLKKDACSTCITGQRLKSILHIFAMTMISRVFALIIKMILQSYKS